MPTPLQVCSRCNAHWCWVCGGDWALHNAQTGGYYRCTRMEEAPPAGSAASETVARRRAGDAACTADGGEGGDSHARARLSQAKQHRLRQCLARCLAYEGGEARLAARLGRMAWLHALMGGTALGVAPQGKVHQSIISQPAASAPAMQQQHQRLPHSTSCPSGEGGFVGSTEEPVGKMEGSCSMSTFQAPGIGQGRGNVADGTGTSLDRGGVSNCREGLTSNRSPTPRRLHPQRPAPDLTLFERWLEGVLEARRALRWSYVLAYHTSNPSAARYLAHLQAQLSSCVEALLAPVDALPHAGSVPIPGATPPTPTASAAHSLMSLPSLMARVSSYSSSMVQRLGAAAAPYAGSRATSSSSVNVAAGAGTRTDDGPASPAPPTMVVMPSLLPCPPPPGCGQQVAQQAAYVAAVVEVHGHQLQTLLNEVRCGGVW